MKYTKHNKGLYEQIKYEKLFNDDLKYQEPTFAKRVLYVLRHLFIMPMVKLVYSIIYIIHTEK